jgi:hypothetical protein
MSSRSRSNLVVGILLVLIGVFVLVSRFIPGIEDLFNIEYTWSLIVIGVGFFLFILGLITDSPGLAVPACIVGGIGMILNWQNSTGDWASWAYLWTLIPGFVGIGIIISGFLSGEWRNSLREGLSVILTSLVLFIIFWLFLGGSSIGWEYWPVILIILGLWILIRQLFRRRRVK